MTNSNDGIWHAGAPVDGLRTDYDASGDPLYPNERAPDPDQNEPLGDPFVVDQFTLDLEKAVQMAGSVVDLNTWAEKINNQAIDREEIAKKALELVEKRSKESENLFDLAENRVKSRQSGYGRENSFPAIRRLWNAYLANKLTTDGEISLTDAEVADILLLFKVARKQTRRASGQYKRDDNVDAMGYLHWADALESAEGLGEKDE